ncbi:MAG TPA: biopolymer transporter ExbD [Polyangia bacterium]
MAVLREQMSRLQGKKAIRSFARKLAEPETIRELNITPMMDMMTIILVFLLKNFSGTTSMLAQDENLQLPPSKTQLAVKEAVPVMITKRMIMVEGVAAAPVNNGRVDANLKPDGDNGYAIQPIIDILTKIQNRERRVAELSGGNFESELQVIADKSTPYRLLTEVLYSCGQAGYSNYRLIVLKTGE